MSQRSPASRGLVRVLLSRYPLLAILVSAAVIGVMSASSLARPTAVRRVSPLTNPERIQKLAAYAYIWGVAPDFVYRFSRYNDLVTAPFNTFGGAAAAAAWNNQATNAGNASALYLNAMLDLSGRGRGGTKELVLTAPPSQTNYYVANTLDAFINTVSSIGTRTTPSRHAQTYLLVGPTSRYAHERIARIHGFTYRVMAFDTNRDWMLIRIRADSLAPASAPTSIPSIVKHVEERFGLSTLREFEADGHRPTYFKAGQYTPTRRQIQRARKWHSAPTHAVAFFKQMGEALRVNPLPTARTGLNGVPIRTLPSWVVPQSGAIRRYRNPAFGQKRTLALFRPLGITASGFRIPRNWGPTQIKALRAGYEEGRAVINAKVSSGGTLATAATNYWAYVNSGVGTYPNTPRGYQTRALFTVAGGGGIVPQDNVYAQINNLDGTSATALNGNNTYKLTFKPPVTNPRQLPVVGTVPPTVNNSDGDPRGFWSITVYQPDTMQSAAPFITQASVLNTAYSTANIAVTAVDASTDTITVKPSTWGPLVASTPILFGSTASRYGLTPGIPYYVATTPTRETDPKTKRTTYSFRVSAIWRQRLSSDNVPIQYSGTRGPVVNLANPGGPVDLEWGPIQPVCQLGSQQLTSDKLVKNADGSVTIWIGPTLPRRAPATNWIPTPSTAYYSTIYPNADKMPTDIRPIMRMYYPAPGSNTQASILPPPDKSMRATYVFPAIQKVS